MWGTTSAGSRDWAVGIFRGPLFCCHSILCKLSYFLSHGKRTVQKLRCIRTWPCHLPCPQVSGYPGSHGVTAVAGSIYPAQASLLDQTDSWNHRPQEISMWQPNVEVSWMFFGFSLLTDEALPRYLLFLNPQIYWFWWPNSKMKMLLLLKRFLVLWILFTKRKESC